MTTAGLPRHGTPSAVDCRVVGAGEHQAVRRRKKLFEVHVSKLKTKPLSIWL